MCMTITRILSMVCYLLNCRHKQDFGKWMVYAFKCKVLLKEHTPYLSERKITILQNLQFVRKILTQNMFKFVYNYKVNHTHTHTHTPAPTQVFWWQHIGKYYHLLFWKSIVLVMHRCETSLQRVYLALMHITTQWGSYNGSAAVEIKYIAWLQHWHSRTCRMFQRLTGAR